jgi:hypothetical protein
MIDKNIETEIEKKKLKKSLINLKKRKNYLPKTR